MTCRELVDFLMSYLDGELPAEEGSVFEQHLDLCPPCKDYLDTYRQAVRLGREVCKRDDSIPERAPEELIQAILAARGRGRGRG